MTRSLAFLAGLIGADALDKEYEGYFHFKDLSMEESLPQVWNTYVSPGDGAHILGDHKSDADLAFAKHLCDQYDSCLWFDSAASSYPGAIGWWSANSTQDTYVKQTTGSVVPGYFHQNSYMHLPNMSIWCNKIAGPWQLPPDQVKAQCDQLPTCHGFTVMNDLSSGFLCAFRPDTACESFLKLPGRRSHGLRKAPNSRPTTCHDAASLIAYDGYYHFKGNMSILNIDGSHQNPFSIYNGYVTPGDGAAPLGVARTPSDLDLAMHLCDLYDSCAWFNSDDSGIGKASGVGYPGAIGWWNLAPTQTTYLKHTAGTIVNGSTAFFSQYMRISGVEVYCNKIAGPWQLPPDQVKAQCDQLPTCHGFTVMNDLSSGFLCAFNMVKPSGDAAFIKLPLAISSG